MANIRSQERRIQRSERERLENRRRTSTVKTYFRRLERALESNDQSAIDGEYRALVSNIDKAAEYGALHRNNAARKKARASRLRAGRAE
jgi:small subunit ribosomal protein S20